MYEERESRTLTWLLPLPKPEYLSFGRQILQIFVNFVFVKSSYTELNNYPCLTRILNKRLRYNQSKSTGLREYLFL